MYVDFFPVFGLPRVPFAGLRRSSPTRCSAAATTPSGDVTPSPIASSAKGKVSPAAAGAAATGLPSTGDAAAGALPRAAGKEAGGGGAAATPANDKGTAAAAGSGGDELWIVGRVLEDMDLRLGAKQEKTREFYFFVFVTLEPVVPQCKCSVPRDWPALCRSASALLFAGVR